uniref:Otopetrin-2 n=1 Tax=Panagrolaimus sp. ES5 TaxID=591445 RepID=A0AC34GR47_9BILA
MIHPGWYNWLLEYLFYLGWIKDYKDKVIIKTGHSGEGAGSLYLALGTLMFGSIGIVLFGLESFMCLSNGNCYNYRLMNYFFAGLFTFVQMHFLFCNSKIAIVGSKNLAKLGTMHLLAVNVWTWFRFVLAKQMAKSIKTDNKALGTYMEMDSHQMANSNLTVTIGATAMNSKTATISSFDYFGDFATFLTTCIIEYSLIGAAIMFVMWRSIDETGGDKAIRNKKKNSRVRIDCSSSSGGLFAGILFLIGSFVSIGIYSYFYQKSDSKGAILVFRLADLALYCFALIGCCLGLYRMRHLQYIHNHSSNSEFLDELLLFIGSMGEFIHCSTGMICWLSSQQEIDRMEPYYIVVLSIRVLQVALQSIFILMATRLRAISMKSSQLKPGKQFVTFLLIANVSLFFFHTLEGMKSVFGQAVSSERARPYLILISAVLPLTVFYRFHSSVCLAEIWKHSYNAKHNSLPTPTNESAEVSRCCSNCQMMANSETVSVERYANS